MVSSSTAGIEAGFSDPLLCKALLDTLERELDRPLRFMEVCGTHTVSIFRSGLRDLLPKGITHLSGPGCPVCVTHEREIATFINLAGKEGVILATFGDLMRVPGPSGITLKKAKAQNACVEVVYSPLDALALAKKNPNRKIVFLGVGFETTAPAVAATIKAAKSEGIKNFFVLCFHKLVPPALDFLLSEEPQGEKGNLSEGIDAFLLPGHVSTVIGMQPYAFLAEKYQKIGVIGGFEPADIIQSLLVMVRMRKEGKIAIVNEYKRAVCDEGNKKAVTIMNDVFIPGPSLWRGFGLLDESGLMFKEEYAHYNAMEHFSLSLPEIPVVRGCRCGDILRGRISPDKCALFNKVCTPANPVGPCMVSTEGSCAAYQKYGVGGVLA